MFPGCWRAWTAAAERIISVTLPLSVLTLVLWLLPGAAAEQLQFDASRLAAGELWRIGTCHFTHWSGEHLAWDLIAFVVLGRMCDRRAPGRLMACLACAGMTIPLVIGLYQPEMIYRGLSGLDSALFTLLAVLLMGEKLASGDWRVFLLPAGMLIAFAAKITYECISGGAIFVAGGEMVAVPLAHVVGGLVGIIVGMSRAMTEGHVKNRARAEAQA